MKPSRRQLIGVGLAVFLAAAFALSFLLKSGAGPPRVSNDPNAPPLPGINSGKRVEVLNGSGRSGLARQATDKLRSAGFDVVYLGNAPQPESLSVAFDRVGKLELAQDVASALGIKRVLTRRDSTRLVEVSVILGSDWQPVVR